jgi:predicted PurR-regulated permease PerM
VSTTPVPRGADQPRLRAILRVVVTVVASVLTLPPIVEQGVRLAENLPEYARDLNEAFDENPTLREANEKYDTLAQAPVAGPAAWLRLVPSPLVAALFGGALLGVVGALLAIPTAAAVQIAVREFVAYRREYGGAAI